MTNHKVYSNGAYGTLSKSHCHEIRRKRIFMVARSIMSHYDKKAKGIESRLKVWAIEHCPSIERRRK